MRSDGAGRIAAVMLFGLLLAGCGGGDGAPGPVGPQGPEGPPGPPGIPPAGPIMVGDGSELTPEQIENFGKLNAEITDVTVSSPPVIDFTVTDKNGGPVLGLDAAAVRFTFVKLLPADTVDPPANGGLPYWQSYINEAVTPDQAGGPNVLPNAVQATTESGGSLEELGGGDYRYTFATDVTNIASPIAVPWEPSLTHRVGMEIRLSSSSGARRPMAPDNPVFDFVPDDTAGTGVTKLIADTKLCESCHLEFAEHGGQRKTVEYCVTCHNPGHVDADSGNSMDMAHMVHSIHMGDDRAFPYIIYRNFGGEDRTFDYGEVRFPQSKTYCESCHTDSVTHPDGDAWNEGATAKTCGGCHADGLVAANFDPVTGIAEYSFDHTAAMADFDIGVQEDGSCANCHLGTIQVAGPALAIHRNIRGDDRARAEAGDNFIYEILNATNTGPGETPVITFRIKNAAGIAYNILTAAEFNLANGAGLNLYVQWATAGYYGGDENGLVHGARINDDLSIQAIQDLNFRDTGYALRMRLGAIQNVAVPNVDGSFTVTFFRALPASFTGDVAIALGGRPALETTDADFVTDFEGAAAVSAVYFPGEKREAAFDSTNCNNCHKRLQAHDNNRNGNYEFCLICHNGDAAVCQSNPEVDGSCPAGNTNEGFHFGRMIHAIHTASTTFKKDDGTDFGDVTYPQNPANCETCHTVGKYNVARATARAVSTDQGADIRVWTDDIASTPNAAVCGVCHTSAAAKGHFESQGGQVDALKCTIVGAECTVPDGSSGTGLPNGQESCAVCHGTGSEFETSKFHNPDIP